ncbi:NUDIX domain-containing protein [Polynucleobacter sp. JS-Mosq-20-D10]|uniref:NUDIX hydrolase n=1 Tax=Polynucleobacter sp. JS-Mosq-20-D10 TaxID=2576922 RepID=UPI001BFE6F22|nr:NUDIX domain-containing protein [Polynucleobacter sp. JS-Mosq-20-D10]QWE01415.1 NUDIX domain-containing protein [Polynucleobacter sp. JS-Mosq-20-D10]
MHKLNNKLTPSAIAALEELLQNTARPAPPDYLPIHFLGGYTAGQVIGYLDPDFTNYLQESLGESPIPHVELGQDRLTINNAKPLALSESLSKIADRMRHGGLIPGWRNEDFAWIDQNGHEYFRLERSAFRAFGFRSMATHINGYTKAGNLWLGRRSETKSTDPGRLDNLAAGGIGADETPRVNARRELWEEAGVPPQISDHIDPVGRIHMRRPIQGRGFHDEQLYIYDLELADNFAPTNHDGEVSGFIEISLSEAAARILADEFTSDAAFVTADFILRNTKTD